MGATSTKSSQSSRRTTCPSSAKPCGECPRRSGESTTKEAASVRPDSEFREKERAAEGKTPAFSTASEFSVGTGAGSGRGILKAAAGVGTNVRGNDLMKVRASVQRPISWKNHSSARSRSTQSIVAAIRTTRLSALMLNSKSFMRTCSAETSLLVLAMNSLDVPHQSSTSRAGQASSARFSSPL